MPTYEYQCTLCGAVEATVQSISSYIKQPIVPNCEQHGDEHMLRHLSTVPGMNSLAGDRHYDGMRATDGTDISSRTKHREYMKKNNLTTIDDFKQTWDKAGAERAKFRSGEHQDTTVRKDIVSAIQAKSA